MSCHKCILQELRAGFATLPKWPAVKLLPGLFSNVAVLGSFEILLT